MKSLGAGPPPLQSGRGAASMIPAKSVVSTLQGGRSRGRRAMMEDDVGRRSYQMDERARFMPLPREIWRKQVFREWSQDEVFS